MKLLRLTFVACVAALLAAGASADDKDAKDKDKITDAKEKIVGIWEVRTKGAPPGATMEFTKDGKLTIHVKAGERELNIEGTYKVDGDKLIATLKPPPMAPPGTPESKQTMTITKLTDTELETKDARGKVDQFTKKKK
jgi:uncharacterized protein (TIGR03066 family)